ncbi:uncharacterized protein CBL_12859 [Carabus blaptoides fortunei]
MATVYVSIVWLLFSSAIVSSAERANAADLKPSYDFIIVGSGSAGSVIANRLSEVPQWEVLLVEVGHRPSFINNLPIAAPALQLTDYTWKYRMEQTPGVCLGMQDQRCPWPRGRGLGGTTLINYMIYTRGHRADYDRWAAQGNPGWSYRDVLPYFLKSEEANLRLQDAGYHQRGGPLSVEDVRFRTIFADAFVGAGKTLGYPYVDYNGREQHGFSYVQANTRKGSRDSAYTAFIRAAESRPNLHIFPETRATKLLLAPGSPEVYGVELVLNRAYHRVNASKEVILCAGAFNSPQLLMLSGIGPSGHLTQLGIPVVKDLPGVGGNMYDHITFLRMIFNFNDSVGEVWPWRPLTNPVPLIEWLKWGQGPFTSIGGVEALGYLKTNVSMEEEIPDMELIMISGRWDAITTEIALNVFGINEAISKTIRPALVDRHFMIILPMHLKPKSIGHLELKSKNPYDWPLLFGNHLSDAENHDVKAFIKAVRFLQRLIQTPEFTKYGARLYDVPLPGCTHIQYDTDAYWECAIRHVSTTLHHQVGTCKMGMDAMAVVDSELKVHGVKGLRVADTSVIPFALNAHTNAPAYMIGEKTSDVINCESVNTNTNFRTMKLLIFGLIQICLLWNWGAALPHESVETLLKEYTEGIDILHKVVREIKYQEASEEYAKAADEEVTEEPHEYDFIIIGAGTSGSVVASRLSEVPEWKVLVLEAGAAENKVAQIPALSQAMQHTDYTWGYTLQPQEHACLGMKGAQCSAVQGKALGGTSAVSSMLYTRGNQLDFDRWADDDHLQTWCYDHVLPWFKKSEDATLKQFDNKYHSQGGPLDVQESPYVGPLRESFLDGAKELGSPIIDYNGKHQLGFGPVQSTTLHGKRRSTGEAFLKPSSHRENLQVIPGAHATQILIGEHTHEAVGVKYVTRSDGKPHVAKAKKEVILAAGVYNSPKLLKLSGVGPTDELAKHGIPVKVDLPGVGENLIDHLTYIGLNYIANETSLSEHLVDQQEALKSWVSEGKGPLASPQHVEALGFIKTAASKEGKDIPDIQVTFSTETFTPEAGEALGLTNHLTEETYKAGFKPLEGHYVYSIQPTLLHAQSKRGTVSLKSKNPFHWPLITGHHLTDADDHDIVTLLHGVRKGLALGASKGLQAHGGHLMEVPSPGCGAHDFGSDDYWKCSIRHLAVVTPQGGTCKMGPAKDKLAVVDTHLKVHGVGKLRVADSSVVPLPISGHYQATAIMIGEKASDLIKESWK